MLLVTSLGFARAFPTNVITGVIEAPVPLAFDHPLPGWPVAVAGANQAQQLALVTAQGRGVRFALDAIPTSGVQALNRDDDDDLVAAVLGAAGDELLLVTDRGYARRLPLDAVSAPDRPNSHGRSLISRGPVSGAAVLAGTAAIWLLGREALYAADGDAVPPEPASTRSHRLLRLPAGETVRAVIGPGNHEKLHNSNSNDMGSMLE
jgi:DNA gyrase/topoisomerase IV subunit A